MNNFSRTIGVLHQAMNVGNLRHSVYANNLANKDVPNFKRTEVNFEASLQKAMLSERYRPEFLMARSDPRHVSNWGQLDHRNVQPRRVLDFTTTYDNNGNNVDPEAEVNKILENQMRYTLYAHAAAFEFNQVNLVLRA